MTGGGLFNSRDSGNRAIALGGPGGPASLGESISSAAADIAANDLSISAPMLMREAYDQYLDGIERQTGKSFANPIDLPERPEDFEIHEPSAAVQDLIARGILVAAPQVAKPKPQEQREAELQLEIEALAEKFPGIEILTPDDIKAEVREFRAEARATRADVAERETTAGAVAAFATGAGVFISDPPVLASMALGAGPSTSILRAAATDAGIAAAVEIPIQATVQSARARLSEETSLSEAALNVTTVGAGGFLFSGILRGAARSGKALVKTVQDRGLAKTRAEKDALAFLERKTDLESQTPFEPSDPGSMAEHQAKVSEAEIAVRKGEAVPDSGPPAAAVRRQRDLNQAVLKARAVKVFEQGPLAKFEQGLEQLGGDLAEAQRLKADFSEAEARVAQLVDATDDATAILEQIRKPPPEFNGERLLSFLQREGGLKDADRSLKQLGIANKSRPGLRNDKTGIPLDEAGLRAFEAGFFRERPTVGELLDAIQDDFNTTPARVREGDQLAADTADEARRFVDDAIADLDTLGIDFQNLPDDQVVQLLQGAAARVAARAPEPPSISATDRAIGEARSERAMLDEFAEMDEALDAALERQIRDEFGAPEKTIQGVTKKGGAVVTEDVRPPPEDLRTVVDSNFTSGRVIGNEIARVSDLSGGVSQAADDLARVDALAEQITGPEGFFARIIVDTDGTVIEGQHRLEALRKIGADTVPIVRVGEIAEGLPKEKMLAAINKAGHVRSEQANQIIANVVEMLEDAGTAEAALREFEMPQGFEAQHRAALEVVADTADTSPKPASRLDEKVMIEDEAGNLVARTARDVLDDLDQDEILLNEFKACVA